MTKNLCFTALVLALAAPAFGGNVLSPLADVEPMNNDGWPLGVSENGVASAIGALTAGDIDNYDIFLNAGERIAIITTPLSTLPFSFDEADTIVEILDGLDILATNDDAGAAFPDFTSLGSVVRFSAPNADEYTIRVRGFNAATVGRYGIMVVRETTGGNGPIAEGDNDSAGTADTLLFNAGPLLINATGDAGKGDFFAANMGVGDVLTVMTIPANSDFTLADTVLDLLGTDGVTLLASNDDAPEIGGQRGSAIVFRAPAAGRYYIRQTLFSSTTGGAYNLAASLISGSRCDGDADGNGVVNFLDVIRVLATFNTVCQ